MWFAEFHNFCVYWTYLLYSYTAGYNILFMHSSELQSSSKKKVKPFSSRQLLWRVNTIKRNDGNVWRTLIIYTYLLSEHTHVHIYIYINIGINRCCTRTVLWNNNGKFHHAHYYFLELFMRYSARSGNWIPPPPHPRKPVDYP